MEIFTGKAKEDFIKWYFGKCIKPIEVKQFSLDIAKAITYATVVEFLDSVGIKIFIMDLADEFYYKIKDYTNDTIICSVQKDISKTRTEAIEEALKKANELYNNLNK